MINSQEACDRHKGICYHGSRLRHNPKSDLLMPTYCVAPILKGQIHSASRVSLQRPWKKLDSHEAAHFRNNDYIAGHARCRTSLLTSRISP